MKILGLLKNPKVHYRVQKSTPLDLNIVNTFTRYFVVVVPVLN
jgi:hypothetical protein